MCFPLFDFSLLSKNGVALQMWHPHLLSEVTLSILPSQTSTTTSLYSMCRSRSLNTFLLGNRNPLKVGNGLSQQDSFRPVVVSSGVDSITCLIKTSLFFIRKFSKTNSSYKIQVYVTGLRLPHSLYLFTITLCFEGSNIRTLGYSLNTIVILNQLNCHDNKVISRVLLYPCLFKYHQVQGSTGAGWRKVYGVLQKLQKLTVGYCF